MGIADSFKDMADKAVDKLGGEDKAKDAVDAAGDKVDEATGGKVKGHVDKGQDLAKGAIDKAKGSGASAKDATSGAVKDAAQKAKDKLQ